MKERLLSQERIWFFLWFLIAISLLVGAPAFASEPNFSPPPPTAEEVMAWSSRLYEAALAERNHPILAVREGMETIMTFSQGFPLKDHCGDTDLLVKIRPILFNGSVLLGVHDWEVGHDEENEPTLAVEWYISTLFWDMWSHSRASLLWHESFHLRQVCELSLELEAETDEEKTAELTQRIFQQAAAIEAEVLGTQSYWYLRDKNGKNDLWSQNVAAGGLNNLQLFAYFFGTRDTRLWPGKAQFSVQYPLGNLEDSGLVELPNGLVDLKSHPNWLQWVAAMQELYVDVQRTQSMAQTGAVAP